MNDLDTPAAGSRPTATTDQEAAGPGALAWLARCMAHESTPRDLRNMRRWLAWMLGWFALAVVDAEWFGHTDGVTSWFTVLQALLVSGALVGVVATFVRYVRQTDELNRRIQLTALSIGFGAAFLSSELGQAAVNAGLIESTDADLPVVTMLLTYAVASVLVLRRYR